DVARDVEIRGRERSTKGLYSLETRTRVERIVDFRDLEIRTGRNVAAAAEQAFAQHAVCSVALRERFRLRSGAVRIEHVEERIASARQQELELDIDRSNAPARARHMARLARASVVAFERVERILE